MKIHRHSYDAVVVGAGGAGLRAAIETAGKCRVAVLTKLYPTRSHTGAAQGGMCAALANVEEDSWEWHAFDTVKGGDYLVDQPAAEVMCREAIDAVIELEHFGMPFNRTPEGRIDQRRFGGHTRNHGEGPVRRACYAADRTGHMILQTLYQQCLARDVNFFNEFQVLDVAFTDREANRLVVFGQVGIALEQPRQRSGIARARRANGFPHVAPAARPGSVGALRYELLRLDQVRGVTGCGVFGELVLEGRPTREAVLTRQCELHVAQLDARGRPGISALQTGARRFVAGA